MICPQCLGKGRDRYLTPIIGWRERPCPRCGGCGITSCCEGATPCDEMLIDGRNKRPGECANTTPGLTKSNLCGGPNGSEATTKR